MRKGVKLLCAVLALALAFGLGWRVMPKVWPGIKKAVVYPVFPQLAPTPAPTPEPYQPKSSAALGDPITASDSLIYYFYKDYCPYCRELEPLTAGLPGQITLPDGTVSSIKLICVNKVEEDALKLITEYYDTAGIPEERRYVPALVIGEQYLFLKEEIVGLLADALASGEGLRTPLLDGADRIP